MLKLRIYFYLAALFVAVHGSGQLTIVHSTESVQFKGHEHLDQSMLKEVFSLVLGFTTSKGSSWPGVLVTNPFNYAEAIVVVVVDGVPKLGELHGRSFILNTDEDESRTWQSFSGRILKRYPSQNNTLMRIETAEGPRAVEPYFSILGDLETSTKSIAPLDLSIAEDYAFVNEVNLLDEIARKVESGGVKRDGTPDVYWFVVSGLHAVVDLHGANSKQAEKAKALLRDSIANINRAFKASYNDHVVVAAMTTDSSHTRRTRSLLAEDEPADPNIEYNLSQDYTPDYPVIFNIILWFSVAFWMAIIATALAIGTMDPGRDSIIYRMTSNRMKKEN